MVHYYFEYLYTWNYVKSMSMADHIASMIDLRQKIMATGKSLPGIQIAHALILSLLQSQSWDVIKIQLFNLEINKLTSSLVSATVRDLT